MVPQDFVTDCKLVLWSCAKAFYSFESLRAGYFLIFFPPSPYSLISDLFWLLDIAYEGITST